VHFAGGKSAQGKKRRGKKAYRGKKVPGWDGGKTENKSEWFQPLSSKVQTERKLHH